MGPALVNRACAASQGFALPHNFVECQYTFRLPVRSTSTNLVSALKTSSDRF